MFQSSLGFYRGGKCDQQWLEALKKLHIYSKIGLGPGSGCFRIQIAHPSIEVKVHKLDHYIREFATILNICIQMCEWSVGKILNSGCS
jgi:hypothetical protein